MECRVVDTGRSTRIQYTGLIPIPRLVFHLWRVACDASGDQQMLQGDVVRGPVTRDKRYKPRKPQILRLLDSEVSSYTVA
jgi:hypothetical protein